MSTTTTFTGICPWRTPFAGGVPGLDTLWRYLRLLLLQLLRHHRQGTPLNIHRHQSTLLSIWFGHMSIVTHCVVFLFQQLSWALGPNRCQSCCPS